MVLIQLRKAENHPNMSAKLLTGTGMHCMRGSRNFAGGPARLPENSSDNVFFFFSPQLILHFYSGLSMVYFKENFKFPRFQRESNTMLAIDRSLCISTGPVVITGFNRSFQVDWWSNEKTWLMRRYLVLFIPHFTELYKYYK